MPTDVFPLCGCVSPKLYKSHAQCMSFKVVGSGHGSFHSEILNTLPAALSLALFSSSPL